VRPTDSIVDLRRALVKKKVRKLLGMKR